MFLSFLVLFVELEANVVETFGLGIPEARPAQRFLELLFRRRLRRLSAGVNQLWHLRH